MTAFALAVAAAVMLDGGGAPPQQASAAPPSGDEPAGFSVGVDVRRDRFRYRFDNPSTFNTTEPVPHFFEQSYDTDNLWVTGQIRYRVGGRFWQTEAAVTPTASGLGTDDDTFFNPDGNVIVYGTTAETDVRSWRVGQTIQLGRVAGFLTRVAYHYRRDTSVYRPSDTTIQQSRPPSVERFWNTDRETVVSELHDVRFGAVRSLLPPGRWSAAVAADATPVAVARLTTHLPDKYPGQPIVFLAKAFSLDASLDVRLRLGAVAIGCRASYGGSWSYSASSQFHRHALGGLINVAVGRQP